MPDCPMLTQAGCLTVPRLKTAGRVLEQDLAVQCVVKRLVRGFMKSS